MTDRAVHSGGFFWSFLTADEIGALRSRAVLRSFRRGQALVHANQLAGRVVILRSGRVKVIATTADGRDVILAFAGPGELVGELAALDDEPRSASVLALEDVEALCLSADDFRSFVAENASASLALLQSLSGRLRYANERLIGFAVCSVLERTATRLLELCERFGDEREGVIHIDLPLTQEELAGWAGGSLNSVTRALQTLRSMHLIETGRRELRVLDIEALKRIAI
jgi:CRP/FNR family cyclic AMP-dependent transcriptional regulator